MYEGERRVIFGHASVAHTGERKEVQKNKLMHPRYMYNYTDT